MKSHVNGITNRRLELNSGIKSWLKMKFLEVTNPEVKIKAKKLRLQEDIQRNRSRS